MDSDIKSLIKIIIICLVIFGIIFVNFQKNSTEYEKIRFEKGTVKPEINKLFSDDSSKKIVFYPSSRFIKIQKGESGGLGFSIRNTGEEYGIFSYNLSVGIIECKDISEAKAEDLISSGNVGGGFNIPSGDVLENPIFIKFDIPSNIPNCNIRYYLNIEKDGNQYGVPISLDIKLVSKI